MNTRKTSDYSPTRPGSREEKQAINARAEMMKVFASITPKHVPKRKSWAERMSAKTGKTFH